MSATLSRGTVIDNNEHQERPDPRNQELGEKSSLGRVLGEYVLTKTLGAGNAGKVKLAVHTPTGQKFAIKIVPRVSTNMSGTPLPPSQLAKAQENDTIKETRHVREAALGMLLHHPYICGMREMIAHTHHYYMVFEYVDGSEMLDYIISHGRLRERVARKFARQIGSALEYCHENNVVHRDLKIENILISQTGYIKIIDFGLSNLFNLEDHLSTHGGSLYYAAPELLNGKVYTGPEIDVWSFGVVLYVLVCGKVPFDDRTVSALQAKVKRECKHLISRMIVTNPQQRATLAEVLSHPWMIRSFGGPPDLHLMPREPLTVLDPAVIREMTGFEFGTPDQIHARLVQVLTSGQYRTAVEYWNTKNTRNFKIHPNPSTDTSATPLIPGAGTTAAVEPPAPRSRLKQLVGLVLHRNRNLASPPQPTALARSLTPAVLRNTPVSEQPDPTCRFHPLVSIYYLVRERIERERASGTGQLASSQLSFEGELRAQQSEVERRNSTSSKSAPNPTETTQPMPIADSRGVASRPRGPRVDQITSLMTVSEVVSCLSAQGCEDLTGQLDLASCSQYPISNGGFGDIYQGKLICGTAIAIKTMRMYVDTDSENRKRFKASALLTHAAKELYTWSKCQHRNVQRLLGLAEFRGQIAMVSVWEINGNLGEYLRLHPDVDRCQLSAQIAKGLAYLHESNIVSILLQFSNPSTDLTDMLKIHGDLKAANVLVSEDGVPLLADFGNANLQGCTLNFTGTSTKTAVSMRWAAPELLEGTETHSAPADVYALGMTILETITGSLPWSGRTEQAVMVAIMIKKESPERPKNQIPDGCEHGDILWNILTRCWAYEPRDRPSATEVEDIMQGTTPEGLVQIRYPPVIFPHAKLLR